MSKKIHNDNLLRKRKNKSKGVDYKVISITHLLSNICHSHIIYYDSV